MIYQINFYLKVTRASSANSTLGAVTFTFTDATDSVAQSVVAQGQNQAGAAATTNNGNSLTTVLTGQTSIWSAAGQPVRYAIAYTSNGSTAMQYEAHLKAILL